MISQYMGAEDEESVSRLSPHFFAFLLPVVVSSMVTTVFRCMEAAKKTLYASILALFVNTGLNYLLIFGKGILPAMGVKGVALATAAAQLISCAVLLVFFMGFIGKQETKWIRRKREKP